jgi:hypothetical protein
MNIFKALQRLFDGLKKNDTEVIDKDGLALFLSDHKEYIGALVTNLKSIKDPKGTYSSFQKLLKQDRDLNKALGSKLVKQLNSMKFQGKAVTEDPFSVFIMVGTSLLQSIEAIEADMDSIIANDEIIVSDIKLSHSLFLGIIGTFYVFSSYVGMFVTVVSKALANDHDFHKYMLTYLSDNHDTMIGLCNSLVNSKGRFNVLNEINAVKKKGLDVKIVSSSGVGVKNVSKFVGDVIGIENLFVSLFALITRPILTIGTLYVDMRHEYYASIQTKKQWMESRIALINMNMAEVEPGSEEYMKLSKIADVYSDKVAEYDKKLNRYFKD